MSLEERSSGDGGPRIAASETGDLRLRLDANETVLVGLVLSPVNMPWEIKTVAKINPLFNLKVAMRDLTLGLNQQH